MLSADRYPFGGHGEGDRRRIATAGTICGHLAEVGPGNNASAWIQYWRSHAGVCEAGHASALADSSNIIETRSSWWGVRVARDTVHGYWSAIREVSEDFTLDAAVSCKEFVDGLVNAENRRRRRCWRRVKRDQSNEAQTQDEPEYSCARHVRSSGVSRHGAPPR